MLKNSKLQLSNDESTEGAPGQMTLRTGGALGHDKMIEKLSQRFLEWHSQEQGLSRFTLHQFSQLQPYVSTTIHKLFFQDSSPVSPMSRVSPLLSSALGTDTYVLPSSLTGENINLFTKSLPLVFHYRPSDHWAVCPRTGRNRFVASDLHWSCWGSTGTPLFRLLWFLSTSCQVAISCLACLFVSAAEFVKYIDDRNKQKQTRGSALTGKLWFGPTGFSKSFTSTVRVAGRHVCYRTVILGSRIFPSTL